MTPEQQVCSLELAQRLKSFNVKQESLFYWAEHLDGEWGVNDIGCWFEAGIGSPESDGYSAFTVAELGEQMIDFLHGSYHDCVRWNCRVGASGDAIEDFVSIGDTEANARASALIYLIEQGHVTP